MLNGSIPPGRRIAPARRGLRRGTALVLAALVALIAAVVVVVTAARHDEPVARLRLGGDQSGRQVGIWSTSPDTAYTVGGVVLCLDRPGRVTLAGVRPVEPSGGLRVDRFVAIPNPVELGEQPFDWAPGPLAVLVYPAGHPGIDNPEDGTGIGYVSDGRTVDHACPPETAAPAVSATPRTVFLYVEYSKPGAGTARDGGLAIDYRSGGQQLTLVVPHSVVLCGPNDPVEVCHHPGS